MHLYIEGMNSQLEINTHKKLITLIGVVLFATIFFETGQQYFYVTRFNLADDVSFFYLFESHLYKWIIWSFLSVILSLYTRKKAENQEMNYSEISGFALLIFALVFVNILLTSVIQLLLTDDPFSFQLLVEEYIPFLTFQKLPLYVLGYVFLALTLYFYFTSRRLQVKVQELGELKEFNSQLYQQLRNSLPDKTSVLNIKIGQNQKVIPIEEISWIEADDYCVKVHTKDQSSYVMRISLKALEEKLDKDFLRVHRKAIVNIGMIRELQSNGSHQVILTDHTIVPVAKSKLKTVRDSLALI